MYPQRKESAAERFDGRSGNRRGGGGKGKNLAPEGAKRKGEKELRVK